MNKQYIPNIVRGGIAVPLGNNYYFMKGRKHKQGGIDVGKDLEVEDGEIMKVSPKEVKVFSSVPFLNGQSPVEKLLGGENPNKVFAQQERFKKVNKINDDGTKAKWGIGETYNQNKNSKPNSPVRTKEDENVPYANRLYYSKLNPLYGYPTSKKDALVNPIYAPALIKGSSTPNEMNYIVEDSVSDAAWRKRLGLSYNNKFLIDNGDGSVKLHKDRENEIPVDTNLYINRINSSKNIIKKINKQIDEINTKKYNGTFDKNDEEDLKYLLEHKSFINGGINVDNETLNALRKTYKTGKAVTVNEHGYNSRNNSIEGDSPLNMLQNYGIQYDKDKNVMKYFDTYDFNQFETFVPGKPFDFKGEIKLNKKRLGGKANIYRVDSNGKSNLRMNISTGDKSKTRKKAFLGIDYNIYKDDEEYYNNFMKHIGLNPNTNKNYYGKTLPEITVVGNPNPNTNTNKKFVNKVTTNKNTNKVNVNTNKNINNEYKPRLLPSYFTLNGERLGKSTDNGVDIKPGVSDEFFVKTVDKNKLIKPTIKNNNIFKTSNDNKPKFLNATTSDYIGFGANALGNIASALINANTINKMKYNPAPISKMSAKLKTNFNINPQLDHNREILHQGISDIDTNTSSSNVGLNRKNQLRLANIMNTNKLYNTKENVETELINKDKLNQQNVANSNIDDYNKWSEKEAAFNNAKLDKLSENRVSLVQGLSQGVNNFINNIEKRKQFNNNLIAIMAANPNVNPRILKELGFEGITDEKIANWERVNKR